jgi:predicted 2-oxoglutarate/Fe(II)-dependent dioxygenase YbiX
MLPSSHPKKGTRIVDNVEFFPSKTAMPQTSANDMPAIADLELSNSLQNPTHAATFSHIGNAQLQSLRQLSEIFSAALPKTTAQHAP